MYLLVDPVPAFFFFSFEWITQAAVPGYSPCLQQSAIDASCNCSIPTSICSHVYRSSDVAPVPLSSLPFPAYGMQQWFLLRALVMVPLFHFTFAA
jgi:hypothetical protein